MNELLAEALIIANLEPPGMTSGELRECRWWRERHEKAFTALRASKAIACRNGRWLAVADAEKFDRAAKELHQRKLF